MDVDNWTNCYDEGWKGMIVDEAFTHPAKISYALSARIYDHAFSMTWVRPGDTVVDPFGGIGGTALHAAIRGVWWLGCELEPKFHSLANQNFDLWQRNYGHYPEWCRPTMVNGDSRNLCELLGAANLLVSSPPYAGSVNSESHGIDWTKAGPATGNRQRGPGTKHEETLRSQLSYGDTAGQLGSMPEGDAAAVISSPPYATGTVHDGNGIDQSKLTGNKAGWNSQAKAQGYGDSDGQLSSMVVGSPPYAESAFHKAGLTQGHNEGDGGTYGDTSGNISNHSGETFWGAARDIVAQCHAILRPGGVAIWVCKDFVRAKQRVPFSDQWLALCESIGFRLVCRHRASLVKVGNTQKLLDGGEHTHTTERKSFFRRLAKRKVHRGLTGRMLFASVRFRDALITIDIFIISR